MGKESKPKVAYSYTIKKQSGNGWTIGKKAKTLEAIQRALWGLYPAGELETLTSVAIQHKGTVYAIFSRKGRL